MSWGSWTDDEPLSPHQGDGARSGPAVEWGIETGAPIVLLRAGIKPTSLQPGDKITLKAHPMKDGSAGGSLIEVKKEDGTVLSLKGPRNY